jgi:hypothetical protein
LSVDGTASWLETRKLQLPAHQKIPNAAAWAEAIRALRDHPALQSFQFFRFGSFARSSASGRSGA